ncbi:MAG: HlyD family efflux transporter periplasmic adaptor subunit [Candidatus Riflebacteria bacterium]|nr:HlyD family efflux transporter periplasmic adaptor subunit [Candidatus Riflebacteria bacterium]
MNSCSKGYRRFLSLLCLCCSVILLSGFGFGFDEPKEGFFVPVKFGDCLEKTVYYGETQAKETISIHAPEMKGEYYLTVKEVLEDGAQVKKGDQIIEFDSSSFYKELESAKNALEVAKADFEKTLFDLKNRMIELDLDVQRKELELAKAKVMVVENSTIISKIDLEKSKLTVKMAEMELKQAQISRQDFENEKKVSLVVKELQVKEAERKMEDQQVKISSAIVLSPGDGMIFKPFVRLNNEKGKVEKNKVVSPGDKLLEIPDLASFQGIIYINPSDTKFVQVQDRVSLFLTAQPDHEFKGFVTTKENYQVTRNERLGKNDPEGTLEENKIVIEITGHDPIFRPGMSFRAEIVSVIASQCLYIPVIAVQKDEQEKSFVWVKKTDGSSEKRTVSPGRSGITFIEIVSGLAKDELVRLDVVIGKEEENEELKD